MKSSFQTILIIVCIASFIGAILVFAGVIKIGSSSKTQALSGTVTVWGTYPADTIKGYLDQINIQNNDISIQYVEKSPGAISSDLVGAIADGISPDIVIGTSGELFSLKDRLYTIPFTTYNERLFRDSFVDGASILLVPDGVFAIPLLVDPLVVYYNKDLLAGRNYVIPPSTWTGLVQSLPLFVRKDSRGVLVQSAIGLGESDNVNHFKDILSALFLQTGNSIVSSNGINGKYEEQLSKGGNGIDELPSVKALDFYTSFANQASSSFSWSRTLPNTLDMFLSGKSAFYIGKASELFTIQARNPNLNFDVTTLFQADGAVRSITYGSFSGVALVKTSPNFDAAYSVLGTLSSPEFIQHISSMTSLPPARRDLLLVQQQNPYVEVFFKAALSAFSWPDRNPMASEAIFRDMIRSVNSGRADTSQTIFEAARDLQSII